jgi:hypothetical protein
MQTIRFNFQIRRDRFSSRQEDPMSVYTPVSRWIKTVGVLIGLSLIGVAASGADNAAVKHFNVIGSAFIHAKNLADARQHAIDDALAAAVGQVVMDILPDETVSNRFQIINEKILAQRETYILNYRVVTESVASQTIRALVLADVSVDRIKRDLDRFGLSATENQDTAASDTGIDVVVAGTGGHIASFVRLRTAISSLSGVKDIKMKEMSTDQAVIAVTYLGTAQSLADKLQQGSFQGFAIAIDDVADLAIHIHLLDQ